MIDEQQYIDRILKGDTDAYRDLVERYQTGLIIHCENILKDRGDGEDIAQEALIKAYNSLQKFSKEKAQFSTWLYRIATNLCIDLLRKSKRQISVKNIESLIEATSPQYLEEDEIRHIRKLVSELEPPKFAEIIKAYFWEGKSYQEIADMYETSTNTVGTWMSRAKQQLKENLA
jgi:RNA polymerase sigma factor (sigma-70 family)